MCGEDYLYFGKVLGKWLQVPGSTLRAGCLATCPQKIAISGTWLREAEKQAIGLFVGFDMDADLVDLVRSDPTRIPICSHAASLL